MTVVTVGNIGISAMRSINYRVHEHAGVMEKFGSYRQYVKENVCIKGIEPFFMTHSLHMLRTNVYVGLFPTDMS